jgi:transcriptional regulator
MYLRAIHAEPHIPTLRRLIQQTPLGILITAYNPSVLAKPITTGPTNPPARIHTTHLPWVLVVDDETSETELGTLKAHMARQNPQAKVLLDLARATTGHSELEREEVCVIFTSPADHYISPSFYVESKPKDGKVVPTWDYASVAAYGYLKVHGDKSNETSDYLDTQLDELTDQSERRFGPHKEEGAGWKVQDAPRGYTEQLKRAIIGIELKVTRLEGKWKMSQESGEKDRQGVVDGLRRLGEGKAREVADVVEKRSSRGEKV